MAQTFLPDAEVDQLVAAYEAGATLRGLAKQFHIHRLTAAAHLARRGVPVRRAGLDSVQSKEAARLYEAGWTLVQLGRRFQVDAQTVRRTITRQGWRSGQVDALAGVAERVAPLLERVRIDVARVLVEDSPTCE